MQNLTHVLGDESPVAQLATTRNSIDIIQRLTNQQPAPNLPAETELNVAKSVEVEVSNFAGLHARPATAIDLKKAGAI